MTRKRHKRDRQGRFSKYDSRAQADRGKRAHENRLQTWFRNLRWTVASLFGRR